MLGETNSSIIIVPVTSTTEFTESSISPQTGNSGLPCLLWVMRQTEPPMPNVLGEHAFSKTAKSELPLQHSSVSITYTALAVDTASIATIECYVKEEP